MFKNVSSCAEPPVAILNLAHLPEYFLFHINHFIGGFEDGPETAALKFHAWVTSQA
jgi:hypothetical protein